MTTLEGLPIPVQAAGPEQVLAVVLLGAAQRAPAAYDAVCERLHHASLRTVVIGPHSDLTAQSVIDVVDALQIGWAVLVGDGAGADLAWELAATRLGRFLGLVVIDRGHPRAADVDGKVRDAHCPAVEVATTVLVSSAATRAVARASQQFVYDDYRVVDFPSRANTEESTAQLATEIVLRTSTW